MQDLHNYSREDEGAAAMGDDDGVAPRIIVGRVEIGNETMVTNSFEGLGSVAIFKSIRRYFYSGYSHNNRFRRPPTSDDSWGDGKVDI